MGDYRARTEDVVVEDLDNGLIIYDRRSDIAHWLEPSTAAVWRAYAEHRGPQIPAPTSVVEPVEAALALERLLDIGLIEAADPTWSRRALLGTAAKVGIAGAAAAPIVSTIVPVAAAHASTGGGTGNNGGGAGGSLQTGGTFFVPPGYSATISGIELSGCNELHVGYQIGGDGGTFTELANNLGHTCVPTESPYIVPGSFTIGPAPSSGETFVITLNDTTCGHQFHSDKPTHSLVVADPSSPNSWIVYQTDSGGFCTCDESCPRPPVPTGHNAWNAQLKVTIHP